jgi:acyl-CoA synthetase (AMP-forming)/AMP-acid ligase II
MSLWEQVSSAEVHLESNWGWDGSTFRKRTYGEMFESARAVGAALRARGVQAGELVPAVLTNGLAVPAGVLGVWMTGAAVASLPIIARGMSAERYGEQILRLASLLDSEFILIEERFLALLPDDPSNLGVELVSFEGLEANGGRLDPQFPGAHETALVQFSSGTTGEPRGAELATAAIGGQLRRLRETMNIGPGDVGYSWLPMSHDMGLIGCGLLSWYSGMTSVLSTPERFLQSPRTWLEDCAELQVTVTAAPPFALDLAVRADKASPLRKELMIRHCTVGAERIHWDVLARTAAAFDGRGLGLAPLTAAYGLAEATLAVTTGDLESNPTAIDVDPAALAAGSVEIVEPGGEGETMRVVSVGKPLAGVSVEVEGEVGEIRVESPCLAKGYFRNKEATAERFLADGFRTADVGFKLGGDLFVTGRTDDLIILGGKNVYVEALEEEIGSRKGIRKGNCAIVATRSGERQILGVVAEAKPADDPDLPALERTLKHQVLSGIGVSIDRVVFLSPGSFPKTPSGKVQRYLCRQMISDRSDQMVGSGGSNF